MLDRLTRDVTPADEQAIASFMARLARASVRTGEVPSEHTLWWKAQLLRRWEAERKATLPLDVVEPVPIIAALATSALLLIWALPSVVRLLTSG